LGFFAREPSKILVLTANTLAGLGSLEILSFENNTITEIDANAFLHTPKLQQLNLGSNSIDRLSLQHLPNLRTLFIHQNRFVSLASITTGSRQLLNLESFYMDKNNVTEVADTDLKQMPSLVTLSLNQNLITRIDPDAFVASQSLASLSLENNRLSLLADSVFQPLQQLRILQLSHNAIESIGERTFARLRNLRKLVLSHNHIADVDDAAFSEMYALERLYLDSNLIKTLKNGTFANFEPRRMNTIDLSSRF
jgi:Leucine-rich repeat (LRR) protein